MLFENELINLRKEWYSSEIIQYLLTTQLKNRELALLNIKDTIPSRKVRYIKAFHSKYLMLNFDRFGVLKYPNINLYMSLAHLKYFPTASFNLNTRTEEQDYIDFGINYNKYIIGYDILFDIDASSMEEAYPETKAIKQIMDEHKIAYAVYPSGRKGWHIRIPYEYTKYNNNSFNVNIIPLISDFIYYIKEIYGFSYIDDSITDSKRIAKLPYSLVWDKVILPLDDREFESFNPDMISINNLNIDSLRNRGLLIRKHGLSDEELRQNFQNMIDKFKSKD